MAIHRTALAAVLTGALALTTLSGFTTKPAAEGIDECSVNKEEFPLQGEDWVRWVPDVGHPVFWGYQDVGPAQGAPGESRVYYPSLDGSPQNARIAKQCAADYPVVLFLHGQPPAGESTPQYNQDFHRIGADLARSGYVVVAPSYRASLPGPWGAQQSVVEAMADVHWVRTEWTNAQWVDPRLESSAVIGHSYGALLAARVAAQIHEFRAFVSLSGPYQELDDASTLIQSIATPTFFVWADGHAPGIGLENLDGNPPLWDLFGRPKHRAVFKGEHFDYLDHPGLAPVGPCHPAIGGALADLATLFVARNLPIPAGGTEVAIELTKPQVPLTLEQEFYAGAHLAGLDLVEHKDGCHIDIRWDVNGVTGDREIGP